MTLEEIEAAIAADLAEREANKQAIMAYLRDFRDQEMEITQEFLTKLINLVVNDL